jgi:hypothetical protein
MSRLSTSVVAAFVLLVLISPGLAKSPEEHWAWKRPVRAEVPVLDDKRTANPIDAFVRAKLKEAGLEPAPPATREQLIRRVTFDLTGLPPTPEEIDAFVKDESPDAWEKVVDRLLASPRYGERWARHWLDIARYADTNGYEFDEPRPDAWRYRDYVIKSFNEDKPYDRFIIEQIAGDEAFPGDPAALVATGFNLLGPDMTDSSDQLQRRYNTLIDMTDTTSLAFLGLTVTCARCHDHKFEPIPQVDYYRLQAFFTPAAFRKDLVVATGDQRKAFDQSNREYQKLTKPIRDEIAAIEEPVRKGLHEKKLAKLPEEAQQAYRAPPEKRTGGQQELVAQSERLVRVTAAEITKSLTPDEWEKLDDLQKKLKAFDGKKPAALPVAMGLTDNPGVPPKTFLLERGELANRAEEVQPGFPSILEKEGKGGIAIKPLAKSSGRRLALAKWIASPANPLTARVIVNRLWQYHFGRGIVPTTSDFGLRGDDPTHPELLDWLACELMKGGWKLKRLHHLTLLSETYRQSTHAGKEAAAKDPDNLLFSRMNRVRLEGEAVRDSLLAISGRLHPKMYGPGVVLPEVARGVGGGRAAPITADAKEHTRRSIYLFQRRNLRHPFLAVFDLPDSNLSCPKRERSTTAPQALSLLNAPEVLSASSALAERLTREAASAEDQIELAYRLTLGRKPSSAQAERAKAFLKDSPLSELCRALFNLNEFVYLD